MKQSFREQLSMWASCGSREYPNLQQSDFEHAQEMLSETNEIHTVKRMLRAWDHRASADASLLRFFRESNPK